jgi:subtilase family serine protease
MTAALNRPDYKRACAAARAGHAACLVLERTNVRHHLQPAAHPDAAPTGDGYGPSSLQSAYVLPSSTAGSGQTVAVVDAYNDPDAASDLAVYRSAWGLPACGSGCFSVVNENGAASPLPAGAAGTGWDVEESLDVDMVSAICPLCHIILVEANSASYADLGTAENSAVNLGAKFVSNSYGGADSSSDATYDADYYNHPGVAITASAGDDGYGVEYPAASQYVTAVGGTSLSTASNARGWTESVWGSSAGGEGTGSGCSAYETKPAWQTDTGCTHRTNNDTAADANPNTGVAVYDSYTEGGWLEVGGTSAASPMIAATFALAGTPAAGTYPSSYIYQHTASLFDVTSGADGSCSPAYLCTAETGYDGPTGWGTPDGTTAFTAPSSSYEIGFQANTTSLWTVGSSNHGAWNQDMASGTSPSVAALAGGAYEAAFEGSNDDLYAVSSSGTVSNLELGMMPGTSPSITALTGGGYEIAFQANTGYLWVTGTAGTGSLGYGMATGTSPSIAGLTNGSYEVAFQANTGSLWTVGSSNHGTWSLGMATGTSPSITGLTNGSYQVAVQANNSYLYTVNGSGTVSDLAYGMAGSTSPSVTS